MELPQRLIQTGNRYRPGLRYTPSGPTGTFVAVQPSRSAVAPHWAPEQVFVLSLARRPDRLERFTRNVALIEWPFLAPELFFGIDGAAKAPADVIRSGFTPGGWGGLRSQEQMLATTLQRGRKSILILEDDAEFPPDFCPRVLAFLQSLPDDWDGLMIGGDHEGNTPTPVAPGIVRCRYTVRVHCYALRGSAAIEHVLRHYRQGRTFVDRILADLMGQLRFYAPEPFIVGQAANRSDVDHGDWPSRFA
jgi:hypothetical protein